MPNWILKIWLSPPSPYPAGPFKKMFCRMTNHWFSWVVNNVCTTCHKG